MQTFFMVGKENSNTPSTIYTYAYTLTWILVPCTHDHDIKLGHDFDLALAISGVNWVKN